MSVSPDRVEQVGGDHRRRGKESPLEGLFLAGGPSSGKMTWLSRPPRGVCDSDVGRGGLPGTPWAREGRFGCYAAAAQEEHSDEGARAVKTEGAPGDHSQFVVEPFDDPVGESGFDVGEDAVFVFADCLGGRYEGAELGSGSPCEPTVQLFSGGVGTGFIEDSGEGFLE